MRLIGFDKHKRWGLGAALLGLVVTGCSKDDVPDVAAPAALTAEDITVSGRIAVATGASSAPGTPIRALGGGAGVSGARVTIKGDHANKVVNGQGDAVTELTTDDLGLVSFHLRDVSSTDFPVRLKVVVSHPDYETTGANVSVSDEGDFNFNVDLIDPDNEPTGVAAQSVTGTATSGVVQANLNLNSGEDDSSGGSATMTIPAGVVVMDEDNNPVSGTLTATAVFYNNEDVESMNTFPGGLMDVETDQGEGTFISGSFAAFSIKNEDGTEVKHFSSPVTFTIRVPKTTRSPVTDALVQAGDVLPVWTYDPDSGEWTLQDDDAVVQADSDPDTFYVEVTTDHLSYFNLDWRLDEDGSEVCPNSQAWLLDGGEGYNLRLSVVGSGISKSGYTEGRTSDTFRKAPRDWPLTITASLRGTTVGQVTTDDICAGGTIPVTIPDTVMTNVTVTVKQVCSQDPTVATGVPSSAVYWESSEAFEYAGTTNSSGSLTTAKLPVGESVTFYADDRANGDRLTKTVTIVPGESVNFAISTTCTTVTGGTTGGSGG